MLNCSDLLHLPYTPDLTEGGIAYACRWLACTYGRMGNSTIDHLRRSAGGVAVELAFRRYLSELAVPFSVADAKPFSHPDHYDLRLGGHLCTLISTLITRPGQITRLRQDPEVVLQASALIPLDQFATESHKPEDLYLFAFLPVTVAAAQEDINKAMRAGQTVHLIHPLPEEWRRPTAWVPLDPLVLKSESESSFTVEIGGLDAKRDFITSTIELAARTRTPADQKFTSLAYVHAGRMPERRLGLHSPVRGEAYIIQPHEWGNIWIQGEEILLAGWLTHEEFRRKSSVLNIGMPAFPYEHTRTKNLMVSAGELNPLGDLMDKVRTWEAGKNRLTASS